ncbi:MAG: hypothetical protein R3A11_05325 [Bdellovibrionota bacterium]
MHKSKRIYDLSYVFKVKNDSIFDLNLIEGIFVWNTQQDLLDNIFINNLGYQKDIFEKMRKKSFRKKVFTFQYFADEDKDRTTNGGREKDFLYFKTSFKLTKENLAQSAELKNNLIRSMDDAFNIIIYKNKISEKLSKREKEKDALIGNIQKLEVKREYFNTLVAHKDKFVSINPSNSGVEINNYDFFQNLSEMSKDQKSDQETLLLLHTEIAPFLTLGSSQFIAFIKNNERLISEEIDTLTASVKAIDGETKLFEKLLITPKKDLFVEFDQNNKIFSKRQLENLQNELNQLQSNQTNCILVTNRALIENLQKNNLLLSFFAMITIFTALLLMDIMYLSNKRTL